MLTFRPAVHDDYMAIAALHAASWRQNYRGTFSDHFLDKEVFNDRLKVWKARFKNPPKNQYVHIAEIENAMVAFVCAYIEDDTQYGTLIDNLHVDSEFIGQRIGEKLMIEVARFLDTENKASMYLWVLSSNIKAISFYDRLGGRPIETVNDFDIGDREITKTRYHWPSLKFILDLYNKKKTNEH